MSWFKPKNKFSRGQLVYFKRTSNSEPEEAIYLRDAFDQEIPKGYSAGHMVWVDLRAHFVSNDLISANKNDFW